MGDAVRVKVGTQQEAERRLWQHVQLCWANKWQFHVYPDTPSIHVSTGPDSECTVYRYEATNG